MAWEMAKSDEVVERDVLEPLKGILDVSNVLLYPRPTSIDVF